MKQATSRRPVAIGCVLSACYFFSLHSYGANPDGDQAVLEEIVVTARGRAEKLFDIPDSVTVFSSEEIEERNIQSLDDVAAHTPGVFIINDQDPGTNIVTIRGITANRLQQASIAYVIDGITLGDSELFTADYFDVERIEVLKGPQGALYGKNAIGGVITIVTKRPDNEFGGRIEAGYGDADSYKLSGALTGPIVDDTVMFRLSGSFRDTDGWITNTTADRKVDYYRSANIRGRLMADVTANLTLDFRLRYVDEEGGASWISANEITNTFDGRLSGDALIEPIGDYLGASERNWISGSVKADYALPNGGVITSITGHDDYEKWWDEDLDFLPIDLFQPVAQPVDLEIFTQELRYTSPDDADQRMRWIAGVFFQNNQRDRIDDIRPLGIYTLSETQSDQLAVFGQASFDLTSNLELTGALRWDRDEREEEVTDLFTGTKAETVRGKYEKVQPKISLAYHVNDENMVYVTYAEGFKSGGFNPDPALLPGAAWNQVFDQEETKNYELGTKSSWDNNRYTLTTAAYYIEYADKQEFAFTPAAQVTFNIPEVEIKGIEIAATAMPTENLALDIGYSYTDSEIQNFEVETFLGPQNYSGAQTPNNPKSSLNIGTKYLHNLANGGELSGRVDYQRVGKTYFEVDNLLYVPSYYSLNAMIKYQPTESWSLRFWGRNLTDERWAISAFGQNQLALLTALGVDIFTINAGRQVGVTLVVDL